MILKYSHEVGLLCYGKLVVEASCVVRNELGKDRDERILHVPSEVVYAITGNRYDKIPYMPRRFPVGRWEVFTPQARTSKYLAPFFIPTNAKQFCDVWELDAAGGYKAVTHAKVLDHGYGLHFSKSRTTLGCVKIHDVNQLIDLCGLIKDAIQWDEKVFLEVV